MTPALESVRFEVLGPPRPKERHRLGANGRMYTPEKTVQYERAIAAVARLYLGHWRKDGRYRTTLTFVFDCTRRGDLDNYVKAVHDGLQGFAFENDKQVCEHGPTRELVEPGRARTEVLIERVGDAPTRTRRSNGKRKGSGRTSEAMVKR